VNTERDVFIDEHGGIKNGYYERAMKTKFGEIEDLNVPRDREGKFRTALFDPYAGSIGIDDMIRSRYLKERMN